MYTIAICDTEPIAMEGLRSLLETTGGMRVICAETSIASAAETVREALPSILLVDNALGFHPIVQWIDGLREAGAPTNVVVWGGLVPEAEQLRFLRAGASGIIRKSATLDSVVSCLRGVASGASWLDRQPLDDPDSGARSSQRPLTAREAQVLDLVERGMRNKDIAGALGISAGTVKIHLKHISGKTGVRGRYGLAVSSLRGRAGSLYAPPAPCM